MNKRSFQTISVLLAVSLISFVIVQGMWIGNSFSVAREEVERSTYTALGAVEKKLEQRQGLKEIKNDFYYEKTDALPGPATKNASAQVKLIMHGSQGDSIINTLFSDDKFPNNSIPVPPKTPALPDKHHTQHNNIVIADSGISISSVNGNQITIKKHVYKQEPARKKDLKDLFTKMMIEVSSMNLTPLDEMKADTLKKIIADALKQNGIDAPFEFAVIQASTPGSKSSRLLSSAGFNEKNTVYSAALFSEKIFKKALTLHLYYSNPAGITFTRLKNQLWMSGLFAGIILFAFIYTLRLILKQKKLSDIKNDFINNMTHELKTPIASISIATDALRKPQVQEDIEKLNHFANIIKGENEKMNRHVETVLQLALTDAEAFKPQLAETDLNALVTKSLSNFNLLLAHKNISVVFTPGEQALPVIADALLIENVLNNIIDNAIKYATGPSPQINLYTAFINGKARVSIADNGIGMSKELQKKVFEKFYRGQSGTLHDVKGFGLGLSYVYNIVKAHNAHIEIESQPGKGSTYNRF